MTYNFDPEKWYDTELHSLHLKLKSARITKQEYDIAVEVLDRKLEEMWSRLDGSYQIIQPED